ncbi:sodium/potassium-transporting ATPase subunit beta-like [Ceratina calcarata]|uniref:Sodium/potassium-transporting ATPase subunit beta-like n=1 Tax=Ceratina calcarata TaxID=156304 RepID=A0AAJ7N630_9HYME|nr:sodium/potassium-transporting ATPase subunit beta-like [Ceratina calcarata]
MVILHDDEYYRKRMPQPDLGPLRNFTRFIWNRDTKAFLDRTAAEWGQLGLFYLCFFAVLGSIFAAQMKISIDYASRLDRPFFQYPGVQNSLRTNLRVVRRTFGSPGIVFKPSSVSAVSPIIFVSNSTNNTKPERYVDVLTGLLEEYNKSVSDYDSNCFNEQYKSDDNKKPCFFDVTTLGKCSKPPYGYTKPMQPCVLIKFNKRFDWVPEYYNSTSHLPEAMPDWLKEIVKESSKVHKVWLSCDGANNVDREHIGEIEYIPDPGFPVQYFPFTGKSNYLSPIVALEFKNLTPNRLVTVECDLWASNINQRSGYSLDFQIMIGNSLILKTLEE